MGACQFMPDTWEYMVEAHDFTDPYNLNQSLEAAKILMSDLWEAWKDIKNPKDRYKLCLASYNAGYGNLRKAQALSINGSDFASIFPHLEKVTGKSNFNITKRYVENIIQNVRDF